jgi:hypothetical protein
VLIADAAATVSGVVIAPASPQYVKLIARGEEPEVTEAVVISTVEGEHTAPGLVIVKLAAAFMVTVTALISVQLPEATLEVPFI